MSTQRLNIIVAEETQALLESQSAVPLGEECPSVVHRDFQKHGLSHLRCKNVGTLSSAPQIVTHTGVKNDVLR